MKKPIFNPEFNWGHILMAVSFLVPALVYGFGLAADMKLIRREVDRHETVLSEIIKTQTLGMQNQAVLVQRFTDHLDVLRTRLSNPDRKP